MLGTIAPRIEPPSSIIIPKTVRTRLRDSSNNIQHLFQRPIKCRWNGYSRAAREHPSMEKKVKSVDVIVERLLEVKPVRTDLPLPLSQQNVPSFVTPSLSMRKLRARCSQKEQ